MDPTDRIGDDVTLYHGDCLAVLPTLAAGSVDAVVTDPPYGTHSERDGYGRRQKWRGAQAIANDSDLSAFGGMLTAVRPLLVPDAWVAFFCSPKRRDDVGYLCRKAGLELLGELIWNKKMPGLGGGIRYQHETILLGSFGSPVGRCEIHSVLAEWVPKGQHGHRQQYHTHEKPVGVLRSVVSYVSDFGQHILDPFMGSGTTGLGAMSERRGFTGIEIDPGHYATARARLIAGTGAGPGQLFGPLHSRE